MTTAERDLALALRAELAAIDPQRPCCRLAETTGLVSSIKPRRHSIARLELRLRRGRLETHGAVEDFDWGHAADHCRAAYLRGRFLTHGSLSLAAGRTHLEFVVPADEAESLCLHLGEMDLPASWRLRRGRGVVTWKSAETVGTFLRLVGAVAVLLELESRQVSRSVRGDLNRVINAESANLTRAVAAAARQIEAIETVDADGRLAVQPYMVRVIADLRREVPDATLAELAERLAIHKSAVQRALERIERLALHPDEGIGRRGHRRSEMSVAPRSTSGAVRRAGAD